ncbi:MAG: PKD domain-containing protein, partial [Bacteroidota bacterium]
DLIDVRPSPLVNITASEGDVICPPDVTSTILTASVQNAPGGNGNYTYTWSGGQSGATYTVSSAGSYTLTVTDNANGCETVSTFTVTTCASSPQSCTGVDFSSSQSDCRTFDFTAILSSPWTNPSWDFGDGQFATGYNVSHQYTNSGYYQVTLTGFNGPTFCRETKQVVVHFVPNFIAEFSCTNSMGGNSMDVQLIDQTDFLPGTTLSYSWTYPGGTSTSQNPLVSGMSSGMVTLTVSDGSTTCSTPATYVDVPEPITAIIDAVAPACEGHPIAFSNISTPSVANIVSASWDFGDGSGSNQIAQAERTYTYPLTGPIVGLTVTDIYGCISSTTQAITVYQNGLLGNVSVSAPSNPACPSPPLQLTANYPVNTPTPSFQWYSSDQSVNLGTTNPSAAVPATGEYYVEITDANGCVARSDNETVVITPAPDASISGLAQLCQGENIQWRVNPGSNLSYNWEVITPSGTQSFNGSTVNLTGNQLGTYTAQVTVTDATTSCQEISPVFTTQVTGAPQSLAIANAGPNCAPANLSASVSSPSSVDFVWSTGDVGPTTSAPVSGTVEVTAYTDQGCSATSSIDIGEGPDLADVAVGCYCFRDPVNWSAPQGAGYTYAWYQASSPSDVLLGTNDQQNLSASGVYYVVVTDANGCSSTSEYINMDIGGDCNCRFEVRPLTLDCVGRDDKTGGYIYSFSTVLINSGVALNGLYAVSNEGTVSGLSPVSFPGGGVTTPLSGTFTLLPGQNDAAITFSAVGSNGENCSVTIIVKSFPDCTQDACRVDWSKPNVNCRFVYQGFAYFDFFITATNNGNPVTNLAWYPYTNNSGASLTTSTNFLAGNSITSITGMVRVPQGTTSESFKACGYDAITGQKCCWKITVAFPKCNEVQEPCTEVINKGQKIVCSKPSKDPAGNSLYDFSLKLCAPLSNGLAQLIPQTGQSENLVTNLSVTVSNNNYSLMGTIVDVPNFNEPLCFWAIISSAGEYCWTEICFDIPDCDAPVEKGGASVEHVAQKPWELSRLQVRPNPASTYFQVDYLPLDESAIEWRLMSVDGRLLRSWSDVAADGDIRLETDGLASGLYFLGMYQRGVMVAQERVVILQEP